MTQGGIQCWGGNAGGQLGNGSTADRPFPGPVNGLVGVTVAISAGSFHTCARSEAGAVSCWGFNANGQLGVGSIQDSLTPAAVVGLGSSVMTVAAAEAHTCALSLTGWVSCWGFNVSGQLGDNSVQDRLAPVQVSGLAGGLRILTAGNFSTCAYGTEGGFCWGNNQSSQLGDGSTTNSLIPVAIDNGLGPSVTELASGNAHVCAVNEGGRVRCWGSDAAGQIGDGGRNYSLPGEVIAGPRIFIAGFE